MATSRIALEASLAGARARADLTFEHAAGRTAISHDVYHLATC